MTILVTGSKGQLGSELCNLLNAQDIAYVATDSQSMDITKASDVNDFFLKHQPTLVFHCAAYTAVDAAEEEPGKSSDEEVNVQGTQNIVDAVKKSNATLVYISTDYVFDGTKKTEYQVDDVVNPKNEYGRTKELAEKIVRNGLSKYYIVRTSWVFGKYGKNFVYTMLNLAKSHKELSVVDDQVGRPTWTKTLAEFMIYATKNCIPYGTYQLSNDGACTWYEFAKEILENTDVAVLPVTSADFPQKAYRPRHSVMDLSKVKKTGFKIPMWKDALKNFKDSIN